MRPREAPSDERTAISRRRDTPRASSRLATFTHAMSSTRPTAPNSNSSAGRTFPVICPCSGTTRALQPVSNAGNLAVRVAAIWVISPCAWASETPGARRPMTTRDRPRGVRARSSKPIGLHASTVGSSSENPAGITPTMVRDSPLIWTRRPTTAASPPKRRCHRRWLMSATSLPGRSSSGVNVRPAAASTPTISNRRPDTDCMGTSSGGPGCPKVARNVEPTAASLMLRAASCQCRKFAGAATFSNRPRRALVSQTTTRRSGSRNGNVFSSTPSTTEYTSVVAPSARPRARTQATVTSGVLLRPLAILWICIGLRRRNHPQITRITQMLTLLTSRRPHGSAAATGPAAKRRREGETPGGEPLLADGSPPCVSPPPTAATPPGPSHRTASVKSVSSPESADPWAGA